LNCHHARQLISPYLDQQLTGREMLMLQDHFAFCVSCEREVQSIRQVKALLRGLREPRAPRDLSTAITLRLEQAESGTQGWHLLSLSLWGASALSLPALKPHRGRRLASALALSCLTVVSFALPFAPEARDAARSSLLGPGFGSAAFDVPAPSDPILSGHVPERMTLFPANDLTRLSPDEASSSSSSGILIMTGMDTTPDTSGLEMTTRDVPFGNVQFAVFRPH
jgi:anti-sigma factor RsiW